MFWLIAPTVIPVLTVTPKVFLPLLLFPLFVVIKTTPLEAREPYKAVAAAPFKTEMFSISSGLMSMAALP